MKRRRRWTDMNEIVASFPKNKYEEVRVQIKEYKGYDLIDLRIWTDVKGQDEKVPTTKGLSLNVELFSQLKKAINSLEKSLAEHEIDTE